MIRKTADNNSLQKVNRQTFRVVVYLSYLEDPAKYTICVYLAGDTSTFTTGSDFIIDGAFTCF